MRCALVAFLACLVSAWLSAQVPSLPSTGLDPAASAGSSSTPNPIPGLHSTPSDSLSGASTQLNGIADELETLLQGLNSSLQAAGIFLDASGQSLESSIKYATASINSLAQIKAELTAARAADRRHSLSSGLWRVFGISAASALVGTLLDGKVGQGTAWWAAAGAVGGGAWLIIELRPQWPWTLSESRN